MHFITQRFLKFSIALALLSQSRIGIGQQNWSPQEAVRMPSAEDTLELNRFIKNLGEVSDNRRSEWVFEALQAGYAPEFLRSLQPVHAVHAGHQLSFWVMSDYLSLGDNDAHLHVPLSGRDALSLAASWNMYLPTRHMVNLIYQQATLVFPAEPLNMNVSKDPMQLWLQHEASIDRELQQLALHSGWIQAGHKKDLVLTPQLIDHLDRAAIYGWQGLKGEALQGLATSISSTYRDYSMGVRLVAPFCLVDGQWMALADVLRSPELAPLLSDEGPFDVDRIQPLDPLQAPPVRSNPANLLVHVRH